MARAVFVALSLLVLLLLQSCYFLQSANKPLDTVYYRLSQAGDATKDLMIFLPGIGDSPDQFERHEFLAALQGMPMDAVAVNSHLAYYTERNLLTRLKQDVVEPAFAKGYERLHFVGISLGGYGIMLYMRSYAEDVSSAILLSPYLGEPEHYRYLLDSAARPAEGEENIWPWLSQVPARELEKIYLGYGESDSYVQSQSLLRQLLPDDNSLAVDGGHTWATWEVIWPELLSRAEPLPGNLELAER